MLFDPSLLPLILILVLIVIVAALLKRYRRCPSDKILVVYGSTGKGSAKCVHGGGVFVWPIIQDYAYLNLTPLSLLKRTSPMPSRARTSASTFPAASPWVSAPSLIR